MTAAAALGLGDIPLSPLALSVSNSDRREPKERRKLASVGGEELSSLRPSLFPFPPAAVKTYRGLQFVAFPATPPGSAVKLFRTKGDGEFSFEEESCDFEKKERNRNVSTNYNCLLFSTNYYCLLSFNSMCRTCKKLDKFITRH